MTEPSKVRRGGWHRNDLGGFTYSVWAPNTNPLVRTMGAYKSRADVFKPKKGSRWVVRVLRDPKGWSGEFTQFSTETLREAMRLAKFMVGMQDGH